jgi:hypothetical protein
MLTKREGIEKKYPELQTRIDFKMDNEGTPDEVFQWFTNKYPKPTDAQMQDWADNLTNWHQNRRTAYAKLNQDEMRYDDLINNTTTWKDAIAKVKADNPKE